MSLVRGLGYFCYHDHTIFDECRARGTDLYHSIGMYYRLVLSLRAFPVAEGGYIRKSLSNNSYIR